MHATRRPKLTTPSERIRAREPLNLEHRRALIDLHVAIVGDGADGVLLAIGVRRPDGGAVVGAIFLVSKAIPLVGVQLAGTKV